MPRRCYEMENGALFFSCMAPRSIDTIETLINKQRTYQTTSDMVLGRIHPCSNLQKNSSTGLTGIMTEFDGSVVLHTLDSITDNIFGGISVVKCDMSEAQAVDLENSTNVLALQQKLEDFMKEKHNIRSLKSSVVLEQVLPNQNTSDFWWLDQSCEFTGGSHVKDCILKDHKDGRLNFYEAFTCIQKNEPVEENDIAHRDASCWDPVLRGSVGLYRQQNGAKTDIFLVCVSDFSSVASGIVRSIKSDIGNKINVLDFCQSKEMWFLQNLSLRNRLRIILQVSEHMGFNVPTKYDLYANENNPNPHVAIEVCGAEINSTQCYEHMHNQTGKVSSGVRFFQSCVDVSIHRSILPIYLGDSVGVFLLLADKFGQNTFSLYPDNPGFVNNSVSNKSYLCPVTNIYEADISHVKKISIENKNLTFLTTEDVLHDMHTHSYEIDSAFYEMLRSKNEYGESLFYGIRHDLIRSLVVMYPRTIPCYIQSGVHSDCRVNTVESLHTEATLENVANKTKTHEANTTQTVRYSTLEETLSHDFCWSGALDPNADSIFGFEQSMHSTGQKQSTVCIEWDDLLISSMQKMSMINNHKTDSIKIVPVLFFKNFGH